MKIGARGKRITETRTFGTTTSELKELAAWLTGDGCQHVAMESTGVYWKPVFNILESVYEEVILVNARQIKNVPGRKTDVKDAEWIADLLVHGLLSASFASPSGIRELWELTRYRKKLRLCEDMLEHNLLQWRRNHASESSFKRAAMVVHRCLRQVCSGGRR